ncbi:hypothetical protein MBLNU459_g4197t1 [Dothideomycetes sp. NU459]
MQRHPEVFGAVNTIEGFDVVGKVTEVGPGVTGFEVGDKVVTFTRGIGPPQYGGSQDFFLFQATASWKFDDTRQHEYLKSLGADFAFDYRDKDVVRKIKEVVPQDKHLKHALDCVGVDLGVLEDVVESGGTISLVLPPSRSSPKYHVEMVVAGVIHDLEAFDALGFKFHDDKEPRDTKGAKRLRALLAWTMDEVGKKYQTPRVKRLGGKGLRDGFYLVARIPYPVTAPKRLVVASEAATLAFLQSHGLPVPEVYGYSPTAENAAGTEYIFMEYIRGVTLGDVWFDMTEDHRLAFVKSLVKIESRLFELPFLASGSLYHPGDLPADARKVAATGEKATHATGFCVGPDTSLPLWFGRRSGLSVDRGPYREINGVLVAGAKKEIAYLKAFGRPLHPFRRIRRETFQCQKQSPSERIETLEKYLGIANYLIPKDKDSLTRPTIRHPDLQPNNIIVSKDFEILSLIDWQHCSILPLFLQCGIPDSLANFNDHVSQSLETPLLPSDIDRMDENGQAEQLALFHKRQLHYFYVTETEAGNDVHFDALTHGFSAARRRLYEQSGAPWEGDTVTLKSGIIHMTQKWHQVVGSANICPISFSTEEVAECLRLEGDQRDADAQMTASKEILGIGPEGWVPSDQYEQVKRAIAVMKAEMIEGAESALDRTRIQDHWVYDDMDEDEYL